MQENITHNKLKDIPESHRARYEWAKGYIKKGFVITDFACGCGYGSYMLAQTKCSNVIAYDKSLENIEYAQENWHNPKIEFINNSFPCDIEEADIAVSFETLEHIQDDFKFLKELRQKSKGLLLSVPNEMVIPFDKNKHIYHYRHYKPRRLEDVLSRAGWTINGWFCQPNNTFIKKGDMGRTLLVSCS